MNNAIHQLNPPCNMQKALACWAVGDCESCSEPWQHSRGAATLYTL